MAPTLADENGPITIAGSISNNYTGGTTINRGTVYLQKAGGATAIPGDVTISTASAAATGSTFLVLNGNNQIASSAVMTFAPSNLNYYAYFELLGHDQTLGGIGDSTGHGVIEHAESESGITADSTLTINNTADCSFNGYLRNGNYGTGSTGTLALVKGGPNKLTLAGANCGGYTGGLTVNDGMLDYTAGTLPTCAFTVNGGTLSLGTKSASIPAFQITGGTVSGTGTLTSSSAFDIQAGGIYPALAGSVALNKSGTGTATLYGSAANTFTGGTTISNGKLILSKISGLAAIPGNVTMNTPTGNSSFLMLGASSQINSSAVMTFAPSGSAYAYFELGGKVQILAGISDATGRGVIENTESETGISTTGALIINNSSNFSFNGYIRNYASAGIGKFSLTKAGAGTLTLSGANCGGYSGGLTVSGGTLNYSGGVLPSYADGAYCNYTINGGTLNIGAGSQTIGTFRLTHPNSLVNGTGVLTSNADFDIQAGTVNAVLAGGVGLNKTTGNSATINAPTYTGTTTVSAGVLNFTGGLPGGNYVITGGTLDIGALAESIGVFQISAGVLAGTGTLTGSFDYDVQGGVIEAVLAGDSGLVKTQDGVAILEGSNTYGGTTRIDGGTLALTGSGQINSLSLIDNDATFLIADGAHALGDIVGSGSTLVGNTAQLNAASIVQDTLAIGGDYSSFVTTCSSSNRSSAAVPEPSTSLLLASLCVLLAMTAFRSRISRRG